MSAAPDELLEIADGGMDELVFRLIPTAKDMEREAVRASAIGEIKKRFWPAVWNIANATATRYLRRGPGSAEDLDGACRINLEDFTEGVFVWLVNDGARKYRSYKASPGNADRSLAGWLGRVARNRMIDYLRTSRPGISIDAPVGAGERSTFADRIVAPEPGPEKAMTESQDRIDDLEERVKSLTRASAFRSSLQECLVALRDGNARHFLATFLAYGGLLRPEEVAIALSGIFRDGEPINKQTVATWQGRGLLSVQRCLTAKRFFFEPRQTASWRESFRKAVVMSFPDEELVGPEEDGAEAV